MKENTKLLPLFIGNAVLDIILTYTQDRLSLPLYYVAILVFGSRLFDYLSIIGRYIVINMRNKKKRKINIFVE
ncbi:MAG: DUF1290 domain-containing protein [Romboutsia sp.]|uniref:DUF1290 domain-containing protein n=1 Tax=Romboutsia sp. TaxID=1965302 RepID=UPI003F353BA7